MRLPKNHPMYPLLMAMAHRAGSPINDRATAVLAYGGALRALIQGATNENLEKALHDLGILGDEPMCAYLRTELTRRNLH